MSADDQTGENDAITVTAAAVQLKPGATLCILLRLQLHPQC